MHKPLDRGEGGHPCLSQVPRQRERHYFRIDLERLRPIRPVEEMRIVANTPRRVLRAIVILPSCLDVAVVHRRYARLAFAPAYRRRNEASRGLYLDNGRTGMYGRIGPFGSQLPAKRAACVMR